MSTTAVVWTIVVIVVVLALALVAFRMSARMKGDRRRTEADDIRQRAASDESNVRKHEAEAAEQEALARQARAEADRKAAAADKLAIDAQESGEQASHRRAEQRDQLRAADDVDPDVPDGGRGDGLSDDGAGVDAADGERNVTDRP